MPRDRWFEPPRRVLVLFLVVTLVPAAALAWLSWQLLKQDQALETQRVEERLDGAADLIAGALDRRLNEAVDRLPALAEPAVEALAVTCLPDAVEVTPGGRLLYYPVVPASEEPSPDAFDAAEALEFRQQNLAGAIAEYRSLARAASLPIRAGALVRLGRTLRRSGRHAEALDAYDRLAQLNSTRVAGVPAELLARGARLGVLRVIGRTTDAEAAAQELYTDLQRGRWVLDRVSYEFYTQEVERQLAAPPADAGDRYSGLALAAAVEWLWDEWQAIRRGEAGAKGRRSVWAVERGMLVAWTGTRDRVVALVAGPSYLESQLRAAWQQLGVTLLLADADGHVVRQGATVPSQFQAVRSMADTGLPWTIRVASADPAADLAALAGRRRLLLAGLIMMGLVVIMGSYFTARAVSRELAVARLQSDFVSAVSHEFRTPLTSMRHLTELLDRGVVSEDERRKQYYAALSHETTRLHRLVESLLNFGRMEAGALEYRFEPVSIADLIAEVVAEFQREASADGCRIEFTADASTPELTADREAMTRAIWNLLDNAVKYSPGDTVVRVDVTHSEGQVSIHVRDAGPGIPPEEQKQIFKKFVRGAAARASQIKGTGIGLAMVQHIVRAHHGELRLQSQTGTGSTFSIVLPVEERTS
jgi:signal transduction histidine kinase